MEYLRLSQLALVQGRREMIIHSRTDEQKLMMGTCDYCGLKTRISKKTGLCRPCVRNMKSVVDKYFDGDPLAPLRYLRPVQSLIGGIRNMHELKRQGGKHDMDH